MNSYIFRYDIDNCKLEKILDFNTEPGNWHIYGCSLGIHPQTDELYVSLFHTFVDNTYLTCRFDSDGNFIKEYPMIANYWFPSLPVFPQNSSSELHEINVKHHDNTFYDLSGRRVFNPVSGGIYILDGRTILYR